MLKPFFTGTCTALVTPFLEEKVNYPMMEQLLRRQYDAGIRTVVIGGTTGESATLSDREKLELIRRAKAQVGSNMRIIAGTGSNSTEHTVRLSQEAERQGADGLLVVSPYYNKATDEGLIAHFRAVAQSVTIPVILYNVPSRTGQDIPVCVYQALAGIPNIAGVKEATGSISKIVEIVATCGESLPVWSGNDDLTVPIVALGGKGVISVASNVIPGVLDTMVRAGLAGDFDTAAAISARIQPLNKALFREINPIPVKEAMKMIGFDCGSCRLPLTNAGIETKEVVKTALMQLNKQKILTEFTVC